MATLRTTYGMVDHTPERTAGEDDRDYTVTGALSWTYSAGYRIPFDAINAAFEKFYDFSAEANATGEHPYLYNVIDDKTGRQIGIIIGDFAHVSAMSDEDKLIIYRQILETEKDFPLAEPLTSGDSAARSYWRPDLGAAVITWALPNGEYFPIDCINAMIGGMYREGYQPILYPVFGEDDGRQVGVLLSAQDRDESLSHENFAARVRLDYAELMSIRSEDLYLPWEQENWNA